mmetsp:Transcript_51804/g.102993  ORF Transcript_51804/g.102993 Transcript_51804/m.102993 type:complete len:353 (+) Transcript_51804:3-1061(+)
MDGLVADKRGLEALASGPSEAAVIASCVMDAASAGDHPGRPHRWSPPGLGSARACKRRRLRRQLLDRLMALLPRPSDIVPAASNVLEDPKKELPEALVTSTCVLKDVPFSGGSNRIVADGDGKRTRAGIYPVLCEVTHGQSSGAMDAAYRPLGPRYADNQHGMLMANAATQTPPQAKCWKGGAYVATASEASEHTNLDISVSTETGPEIDSNTQQHSGKWWHGFMSLTAPCIDEARPPCQLQIAMAPTPLMPVEDWPNLLVEGCVEESKKNEVLSTGKQELLPHGWPRQPQDDAAVGDAADAGLGDEHGVVRSASARAPMAHENQPQLVPIRDAATLATHEPERALRRSATH